MGSSSRSTGEGHLAFHSVSPNKWGLFSFFSSYSPSLFIPSCPRIFITVSGKLNIWRRERSSWSPNGRQRFVMFPLPYLGKWPLDQGDWPTRATCVCGRNGHLQLGTGKSNIRQGRRRHRHQHRLHGCWTGILKSSVKTGKKKTISHPWPTFSSLAEVL